MHDTQRNPTQTPETQEHIQTRSLAIAHNITEASLFSHTIQIMLEAQEEYLYALAVECSLKLVRSFDDTHLHFVD